MVSRLSPRAGEMHPPRDQVFNLHWRPPGSQIVLGKKLVEDYGIHT